MIRIGQRGDRGCVSTMLRGRGRGRSRSRSRSRSGCAGSGGMRDEERG